jgi:glucans biosynthesis protein
MSHAFRFSLLFTLLLALAAAPARAQDPPFAFGSVEAMAAKLATEPYREPASVQGDMRQMSYDHYRALRAKPDTALWRDGKSLFHVEFFPAGFIYEKPVEISIVEGGKATPVAITPDQFDFSDTGLKEPP